MNTEIHRLLDEAFAGVPVTADIQDLKEEVRANLISRVDELESSGVSPSEAAARAISELGDVRELVGDTMAESAAHPAVDFSTIARNRVPPRASFVVRTVVWAIAAVVGLTLATLGAAHVLALPIGVIFLTLGVASTGVGLVVGDSLTQETTTNHPMPDSRAGGYALASLLAVFGLGIVGLIALQVIPMWAVVFAAVGVFAAIVVFAFLGATQTNRHKAWARRAGASMPANRFDEEPETAARFGIYVAVIWLVAIVIAVALGLAIGWWWAPVALLGGLAATMLLLGRMMFAPPAPHRKD